jgi:hypothetical protein
VKEGRKEERKERETLVEAFTSIRVGTQSVSLHHRLNPESVLSLSSSIRAGAAPNPESMMKLKLAWRVSHD